MLLEPCRTATYMEGRHLNEWVHGLDSVTTAPHTGHNELHSPPINTLLQQVCFSKYQRRDSATQLMSPHEKHLQWHICIVPCAGTVCTL